MENPGVFSYQLDLVYLILKRYELVTLLLISFNLLTYDFELRRLNQFSRQLTLNILQSF